MNLEEIREFALSFPAVSEELPFGPDTLVFKVVGKIFLLLPIDGSEPTINLKCDPEKAVELRDKYSEILPGYHMNKKHWNTIHLTGKLSNALIQEMIKDSYELVVSKLTKKDRELLQ